MDSLVYWNNIYKTISGFCPLVDPHVVSELLETAESDLILGLKVFKPYTPASFPTWKETVKSTLNSSFECIIHKIAKAMNLDCNVAYGLFCNYLMFEYYGKMDDIEKVVQTDMYVKVLLEKVWHFYKCERMFLLKVIRHILKHAYNEKHRFHELYKAFVEKHTVPVLRKSIIEQFNYLLHEIKTNNVEHCLLVRDWIDRNYIEQKEILMCLIILIDTNVMDSEETHQIFSMFLEHGFGIKVIDYPESVIYIKDDIYLPIKFIEYAIIINLFYPYWKNNMDKFDYPKFKESIESISNLAEEHTLLLLIWTVTLSYMTNLSEYDHFLYECYSKESFNIIACKQLLGVTQQYYLQDELLSSIVKRGIVEFLNELCLKAKCILNIYDSRILVKVLTSCLEVEELATKILNFELPVSQLFGCAINMCPYDLESIITMSTKLLKHASLQAKVINMIMKLESYTEICTTYATDYAFIETDYNPLPRITVPKFSRGLIIHLPSAGSLVQYKETFVYSILHVFEAYVMILAEDFDKPELSAGDLNVGMKNLKIILNFILYVLPLSEKVQKHYLIEVILMHLKHIQTNLNDNNITYLDPIIAEILKVTTVYLPVTEHNLVHALTLSFFLPTIASNLYSVEQIVQLNLQHQSTLIQMIFNQKNAGKYELLHAYMDLLFEYLVNEYDHERITMPGIVFILYNVFPQHLTWIYKSAKEKNNLSKRLVLFIFEVLQQLKNMEEIISDNDINSWRLTKNFCMKILFHYDAFARTFLSLLHCSNYVLERQLCAEQHWDEINLCDLLIIIRNCLSIVLWMFNTMEYEEFKETRFWACFFHAAPFFQNTIKILCEYMNQKFDRVVPKLACKILKKICLDRTIPVLAALEMDHFQVQCMFLERLRDPLEDVELKADLLEMVKICIKNQNGLTAAFFNLRSRKRDMELGSEQTITGYMNEYLRKVALSQDYLQHPLQASILDMFHTLWITKRTILIEKLIKLDDFWSHLLAPLKPVYTLSCETYIQILDILTIQITSSNVGDNLKNSLTVMFGETSEVNNAFSSYIEECLETGVEKSINLLHAWKKFLIFFIKEHNDLIVASSKAAIAQSAINGIMKHFKDPYDMHVVEDWTFLYIYVIRKFGTESYSSTDELKTIAEMFYYISHSIYHIIPLTIKDAFIAIAIETLDNYETIMGESSPNVILFLDAIMAMMQKEFERTLFYYNKGVHKLQKHAAWMLLVMFANKLVKYKEHVQWFIDLKLPAKIFELGGFYASSNETMLIAVTCSEFLKEFAKTELNRVLLYLPFGEFYANIHVPQNLLDDSLINGNTLDEYHNFWLTFNNLIIMNIILVKTRGVIAIHNIVEFTNVLKAEMFKILELPNATADPLALKLVANCLYLCNSLLPYEHMLKTPYLEKTILQDYFFALANSLNNCICLALRPKLLKFCKRDGNNKIDYIHKIPVEFLAIIMDRIVEVITSASLGLLEISPDIVDLLAEHDFNRPYFTHLEYEFRIPYESDYSTGNKRKLTFGAVLCLVHYLCKIILQILHIQGQKTSSRPSHVSTSTFLPDTSDPNGSTMEDLSSYVVLISRDYVGSHTVQDKFNSIQRFANSEIYSLAEPWLALMNQEKVSYALETLNTLLASQIFKSIIETNNNPLQLQLLKRELCSELQFFHEFVRKKIIDQHKYIIDGNVILKNKNIESKTDYTDDGEYLLLLSHWFMTICQLAA